VRKNSVERVYAVSVANASRATSGGTLAWVRGTFCSSVGNSRIPVPDDPKEWLQAESLMRAMLTRFGYSLQFSKFSSETKTPLVLFARHKNGWYLSSYSASTTSTVKLRFPHGAPLMLGTEADLDHGSSTYSLPRAQHKEVRCLVDQQDGEVSCVEAITEYPFFRRRWLVKGLRNATVHFYPEDERPVVMRVNESRTFVRESEPYEREENGGRLVMKDVSGELNIAW
jgi:hypothetical protein